MALPNAFASISPLVEFRQSQAAAASLLRSRDLYELDPVGFIERELGKTLTPDQRRIACSIVDHHATVVPSSHGQGKTALGAWLALWWVFGVGGLCITSAPTSRQVKELLWGEIRKAYPIVANGGRCDKMQLFQSETARAFGFTAADHNLNAFQGIHSDRLFVILDEACGISPAIWDGAESCVTGSDNRLLAIGNPVIADCPFERAASMGTANVISLPAWRHPNVSYAYEEHPDGVHRLKPEYQDPETWQDDVIPGAVSVAWIERARLKGETSPYWVSRVEARFPTDSAMSVIPRELFDYCRQLYDDNPGLWEDRAARYPYRFGVDVGDGGDAHGVAAWQGPVLRWVEEHPTLNDRRDVSRIVSITAAHLQEHLGSFCAVDQVGVGAGALSALLEQGYAAHPFGWGGAALQSLNYLNAKAEQFWGLREAMQRGEVAIAPLGSLELPLRRELAGIYYEMDARDKIRIEPKERTIGRLRQSPNMADAVVGGFPRMGVAGGTFRSGRRGDRVWMNQGG